jgi:hypothetical protein
MSSATIADPEPVTTRLRCWAWRLLLVVGGLIVLVWAAPIIAGYTPLVSWACDKASAALGARVTVGNVSLGWFSPIVLTNVVVHDADDHALVQIPRIDGNRSLLSLLLDHDSLGTFQVKKPTIDITFAGNQSNLEKLLAKSLGAAAEPKHTTASGAATPPQVRFEVVDAAVNIHDADTQRNWPIRALSFSVACFNDGNKTVQVNAAGELSDGIEGGSFKAEIAVQDATEANPKATIKARFTSLPVSLADVLLRRYQANMQLGGSLQGNCTISAALNDGRPSVEFSGEVIGTSLTLATPLLADPLFIERARIPCGLRLDDRTLTVHDATLDCDFGKVTVHGSLDLAGAWLAALDRPDFDLALDINLAKLAERLPRTLHLRRDLRLLSGRLNARCTSVRKDSDIVWQGNLRVAEIRGIRGQQTIDWAEPIALDVQVRNLTHGTPLVDRLECSARFLQIEGSSSADQFTLTAQADLKELAEPLGQFIDLDGVKLAGRAGGALQVRRLDRETYLLHGDAQLKQMNLTWLTKQPWQEELVTATCDARGHLDADGKQRVDAADFELKLGSDLVALTLAEPIADLGAGMPGSLSLRVEGDLARWQKRAASWTTLLDDWRLGGQASVQMQVRSSLQAIDCSSLQVKAANFRCVGSSLSIQEPSMNVQTALRWDAQTGNIALTRASVSCPTIEIQADALALDPATMALRGSADFVASIERLRQWTQEPNAKPGEPMTGTVVGRVDLQATEKRLSADFDVALKKFVYGPAAKPTWQEAEVKCVGAGSYDRAADTMHLDRLHLTSAIFNADAAGTIAQFSAAQRIDVTGTLTYDLARMEPQLRPLLGKDVKIVGKDARSFKLVGPLYPQSSDSAVATMHFTELKGEASASWKSLHALGCDVGPAEAHAIVQQGWLQLYPIETTLNGGKLRVQPNVRLDPEPTEMVLLAGPVIEKAKITPELCSGALGYAMPLLANVAQAEGSLSLSLEGGRVALSAPATSEIKGTIVLHSATVGANPTLRELANVLKISMTTGLVKECKVPFQMIQGKVHHSNLELVFPELTLKSSGAVGLDGSLALVVETPIPPRLAAAAKLTPAQARQTIRIPIGGTLEQPRVDGRALESLTSVLGRSVLENEFNKLLQPKR